MRSLGVVLGLIGGLGQVGVALMGYAIGGVSTAIVMLVVDALVALAGVVLARWRLAGAAVLLVAGLGAVVALFWTTLLEIGVAAFLLVASAATLWSKR